MPAPSATLSSGWTPLHGSRSKKSATACWIFGMRVIPPTSTTSSMSSFSRWASASVCLQMSTVRSMRSRRELLERLSVDGPLQVQGLVAAARDDEREVDLRLAHAGELALGLLGGVLQALQRHAVLPQIDAVLLLEALHQPVDDPRVDVLAAEEGVAGGGDDLEDAAGADLEDRDVERAAAEVVDGDGLLDVLAEAVGERGRGGLVDDADDVEPGDLAGVLGGLPLVVVEVGGDGDDRLGRRPRRGSPRR